MIKSLKHWIADRRELIEQMEELENRLEISQQFYREVCAAHLQAVRHCREVEAERDAALAKLAPPTRDAATGRWVAKS